MKLPINFDVLTVSTNLTFIGKLGFWFMKLGAWLLSKGAIDVKIK